MDRAMSPGGACGGGGEEDVASARTNNLLRGRVSTWHSSVADAREAPRVWRASTPLPVARQALRDAKVSRRQRNAA